MKRIVQFALILAIASPAFATVRFLSGTATGTHTGASWVNAWTTTAQMNAATFAAGDTICMAAGTYAGNGIITNSSGTSGNPITYRRAAAADATCGSTTSGWNSAFDGQVQVDGFQVSNNFITIDGFSNVGNAQGGASFGPGGGILAIVTSCGTGNNCAGLNVNAPTNGVIMQYVEISGPCPLPAGCTAGFGDPRSVDLNHFNGTSYDLQQNMTLQFNNLHGACNGIWSANADHITVQHNRIGNIHAAPSSCHENVWINQSTTNATFAYNEIVDWQNEGILSCPSGSCTSGPWFIYGNIWHDPGTSGGPPRVIASQSGAGGVYSVYNNTFVNMSITSSICYSNENSGAGVGAGSTAFNNLYISDGFNNCGFPSAVAEDYAGSDGTTGQTHGQNNLTTAIFSSFSAHTVAGYNLSGHTTAGNTLSSPYNIDYNGNLRTTWDRGAVQFGATIASSSSASGGASWSGGAKLQ